MRNFFKRSLLAYSVFICDIWSSESFITIQSAIQIDHYMKTMRDQNIDSSTILLFQDLDRCAFYNRAGDITDPKDKPIFPDEFVKVDNELKARCITEEETDAQLRDPLFKNIMDDLISIDIKVMAVTGRPPVRDQDIAKWARSQPLESLYHTDNYCHLDWKKRDIIKAAFLKSHTANELINFAKTKAEMMEHNSGLQFSHQKRLMGEFSKPKSGSAYVNGVAYTGYEKGANILWYLDQLHLQNTIKHIIIVDDDLRSLNSYAACKENFKALGYTLHYLHWKVDN